MCEWQRAGPVMSISVSQEEGGPWEGVGGESRQLGFWWVGRG